MGYASMHIGVFTYYYFPVVNGVIVTIADWMRMASGKGVAMTVFTPQISVSRSTDPQVVEYMAIPVYRRIGFTVPLLPELTLEKEVRIRHISILHVHHPFYIGNIALYFKRKFGLPIVFTYHTRYSDYFRTYLPRMTSSVFERIITWQLVRFMNACNAVTVSTESLRQELLKKGVRSPLFVVAPGIDTKKFAGGDKNILRKRLAIPQDEKILLYVGRLAKEKNIYFLLRSFRYIKKSTPRVHLVLAGSGLEQGGIEAFIRRYRLAREVHLLTDLTPDTIPDAYAGADMFVYASQTETFGRVILEAMSAGLPVVALAGWAIVDIVADRLTGRLVYPKKPRMFARTVSELISNEKQMRMYGAHAGRIARQDYDTAVSFERLHTIYKFLEDAHAGTV